MIILGIHMEHDASVTIIKDGNIVVNIALEKITRIKKDWKFKDSLIEYALKAANLTIKDVNFVALNCFKPNNGIRAFVGPGFANNAVGIFNDVTGELLGDNIHIFYNFLKNPANDPEQGYWVDTTFELLNHTIPGAMINHHIAHAASAFFLSPFKKAAIFTLDASSTLGKLPEFNSLFSIGTDKDIYKLYSPGCMVGTMFEKRCQNLGMGSGTFKAGSLMGLAPYGKVLPQAIEFEKELTAGYWERTRAHRSDKEHLDWQWFLLSGQNTNFNKNQTDGIRSMNIAASTQYIFEKTIEKYVSQLYEETKHATDIEGICFSGGSFLNCAFNGKLRAKKQFKDYYWYPACGDDGAALGAALYAYHTIKRCPRVSHARKNIMYTGPRWNEDTVDYSYKFNCEVEIEELDFDKVASYLSNNKIVAWYNGRSEIGPRALCNRSILASPKPKWMRDYINKNVKNREWFRPFAPVVLDEFKSDWFEMDYESPFMLEAVSVRADKKDLIPAVIHIDNSARVQTLKEEDNLKIVLLLRAFQRLTGIPVLLNTSLNLGGEPLVESPEDAFKLFERGNIDILVLGKKVYKKKKKLDI